MSSFDVTYDTPIQLQQPTPAGTQTLVVGTNGTLEVDGTLVLGTIVLPPLPTTNGYYRIQITGGNTAAWVVDAS